MTDESRDRIAVVGTGIAGMATARLLSERYDVTVYEKNDYIGGHTHTVDIDYDGMPIAVDTGFIVYNHQTYPNLKALFEHLSVPVQKANMSFGVYADGGKLQYASHNLLSVFAQPANIARPAFIRMLLDILRFNRESLKHLANPKPELAAMSLGDYLSFLGVGKNFGPYYLLPMAGAIWSCSLATMREYPALSFLQFFKNHGLLTVTQQPQWYSVTGGSREYARKLVEPFRDRIRLNSGVACITRQPMGVTLEDVRGAQEQYRHVVIATHADQAFAAIKDLSTVEKNVLSGFAYQKNRVVLHRDASLMPKRKKAWASWVYATPKGAAAAPEDATTAPAVHYWMNNLQGIDRKKPLFVSLNPWQEPKPELVFGEYEYHHPIYDKRTLQAQSELRTIQGSRNTWYCGSYHGYGFHEDALNSALQVAGFLGVKAPWQS